MDAEPVRCEATRLCDGQRCLHPGKYLVPYDSSAVCGIHARAYLRCIPLAYFGSSPTEGSA